MLFLRAMITEEISRLLEIDPLQALPIRGFFATRPIRHVLRQGNSLVLFGKSDYLWGYLYSAEPAVSTPWSVSPGATTTPATALPETHQKAGKEELTELLRECRRITPYFANVQPWMANVLAASGSFEWKMDTRRLYFPFSSREPASGDIVHQSDPWKTGSWQGEDPSGLTGLLPSIDPGKARFIQDNSDYKEYTSTEYIQERLEEDISSGILRQGELVAWGLTHDDRSLGFLHVLSSCRRQGLAEGVLRDLVRKRCARGETPFLNVEPRNQASMKLVEKIGFLPDRTVSWVKMNPPWE
ncbi:FR47-like protein [Alkalispirochaeta americana]|uniref:FR47-like protein n=1 Tax=Alkalispirochaeta americana TaxID=159291 RepID=A0A1N6T371_9SPIO|nr:GNAT family N-acetyltransferase [Alkalispirochaeta americana]SIQ47780.1 FR47-like protein [Alkalispirochaeta americana]